MSLTFFDAASKNEMPCSRGVATAMNARQSFRLGIMLLIGVAASPAWAQTGVQCRVSQKMACGPSTCVPVEITTWANINLVNPAFARCDNNGCKQFQATVATRGSYTDIDFPGRSLMAKIGKDGSYVEVEAVGMRVLVSHGACK